MLQEVGHITNTVVLIFWYFQCLHFMCSEVAWVLVSLGTQVQPQIILETDYLPDYLSVFYDYDFLYFRFLISYEQWKRTIHFASSIEPTLSCC